MEKSKDLVPSFTVLDSFSTDPYLISLERKFHSINIDDHKRFRKKNFDGITIELDNLSHYFDRKKKKEKMKNESEKKSPKPNKEINIRYVRSRPIERRLATSAELSKKSNDENTQSSSTINRYTFTSNNMQGKTLSKNK